MPNAAHSTFWEEVQRYVESNTHVHELHIPAQQKCWAHLLQVAGMLGARRVDEKSMLAICARERLCISDRAREAVYTIHVLSEDEAISYTIRGAETFRAVLREIAR